MKIGYTTDIEVKTTVYKETTQMKKFNSQKLAGFGEQGEYFDDYLQKSQTLIYNTTLTCCVDERSH